MRKKSSKLYFENYVLSVDIYQTLSPFRVKVNINDEIFLNNPNYCFLSGIRWMEEILLSNPPETNLCISDVDWDRFTQTLSKGRSLVSCMQLEVGSNLNQEGEGILVRLKNASSKEDQECMLLEFIKTILVSFTGGSEDEIDCFVPLVNYGVDSVGASLFKSKIMQGFNIDLEVMNCCYIYPELQRNWI